MLGLDRSKTLEAPRFDGNPPKIAILSARYFPDVADTLIAQAKETLKSVFADSDVYEVPGVLDLPAALSMAIQSGKYEGYVILGAVIDGENGEHAIYRETLATLTMIAADGEAVGTALLWADNRKKMAKLAARRSKLGNGAALAALHLVSLSRKLSDTAATSSEGNFKPAEEHIQVAAAEPRIENRVSTRAEPRLRSEPAEESFEVSETTKASEDKGTETA